MTLSLLSVFIMLYSFKYLGSMILAPEDTKAAGAST